MGSGRGGWGKGKVEEGRGWVNLYGILVGARSRRFSTSVIEKLTAALLLQRLSKKMYLFVGLFQHALEH